VTAGDLIALDKGGGIHFAEVKYRRSNNYGSGFDYITPDKSHRLRRAALAWTAKYTPERSFQIDVISVSGDLETPLIDYLPNAVTE
jgi:Holliday junction resolvase-like predicted endonuclease